MESGSGPSNADGGSAAAHAETSEGPAPVPVDAHSHDLGHPQSIIQQHKGRDSPRPKAATPRISLSEVAAAQKSVLSEHMHMLHHPSSDLGHYFVRQYVWLRREIWG
jgi:hypothetical protein